MTEATLDLRPSLSDEAAQLSDAILRFKCGEPPAGVQLMPARSKAGFFLLEAHLNSLQHRVIGLGFPAVIPSVSEVFLQWLAEEHRVIFMSRADWGTFLWVDQLFDAVVASAGLDAENAWLLNRFRLPIVHYALKDLTFFYDRKNIARRFLNALVTQMLSTREAHAREVSFVLGGFASRLLELFQGDVARFQSLCLEAQHWFAIQQQRSHQLHLRLRKGIQDETLKQRAQERVDHHIGRTLGGKTLPDVLAKFMRSDWRDGMLLIAAREDDDSPVWKRAARIAEAMVEIAVRCHEGGVHDHYERFLPSLIKGANACMDAIHADDLQRKRVVRSIELIFGAILLGSVGKIVDIPPWKAPELPVDDEPVTIPGLRAEEWVRILRDDGRYDVGAIVVEGNAHSPWVLVARQGSALLSYTSSALLDMHIAGRLELLGDWRPFDQALVEQVREVTRSVPREELLRAPVVDAFASLPVAFAVVTQDTTADTPESGIPVVVNVAVSEPEHGDDVSTPVMHEPEDDLFRADVGIDVSITTGAHPSDEVSAPDEEFVVAIDAAVTPEPPSADTLRIAREQADGLAIGARLTWYRGVDDEVALKLAVKVKATGRYVFVNRTGLRQMEPDIDALAMKIATGELAVVDSGSRFDSALEKIVKQMQKDQKS